ncbi:Pyoverdine/dityrosine biosynthesis protein-domain-containing protein [Durotheca rogersii]|uniref:Pyoverdine/dityrosine biosynthesis protein-domain-containing protein n=1 Tax=Durotheca rogersii TaxID=419775 RepID=UPI00221F5991|nr:Pyoverdine/dityrosine biosynthesis protein-domain-containing protein [Durotheca rogersii]KAI5865800.1 Pyoverdine/dityrosine biosynthesis protein-domain-containing protein [Durotheca rogersii]
MEFSHSGGSIYYRYQASFAYDRYRRTLCCAGPRANEIRGHWGSLHTRLPTYDETRMNYGPVVLINELGPGLSGLKLYTLYRDSTPPFGVGIVLDNPKPTEASVTKNDFEELFVQLMLRQVNFGLSQPSVLSIPPGDRESAAEKIVSLFDSSLRYQGNNDRWAASGRRYFTERVRYFTSQGRSVEFCLPAFPCKSSNTHKVTGEDPDRGEELALERLNEFVEGIEKVYAPGAKLWVVSDGHVFSDCVGVDDQTVDSYGRKLHQINHDIGLKRGTTDRVGFKSIVDLFELDRLQTWFKASQLDMPTIDHHIKTQLAAESEMSRRILMAGCRSHSSTLRNQIESQNPAILALYRGFSRFMLEDLKFNRSTCSKSRSGQKKLSTKIAFEMILRNQAYSNLVEMLFPNHVRLSIHAHNNAGPKFGIQLFDPERVRAVESLPPNNSPSMNSRDLLHIPTPWHNCVVEVAGHEFLYVSKAKVAREALRTGEMTGGLRPETSQPEYPSRNRE